MRMLSLAAGVAALAIAAPALSAKPDKGGGGGHGSAQHGGGGGKSAKAQHGSGGKHARAERGKSDRREARADRRKSDRREARAEHRPGQHKLRDKDRREASADRRRQKNEVREVWLREDRRLDDRRERDVVRLVRRDDDRRDGPRFRHAGADRFDGCPPGLAAKRNGCLPPGQAKQLVGRALPAAFAGSVLPAAYRTYYPDSDDYYYREGDGLIYRIARSSGLVDGYSPLWGYGADYRPDYYHVGERYPLDYVSFYNVPAPYQRYYRDEDEWLYRYGDGGIYRVDRSSGLVDSIVALLAGDLAVGQPLPAGYDVYNLPYAYRDDYSDSPDRWYRYNDGYIYQVDPKTRLIQAVIEALV